MQDPQTLLADIFGFDAFRAGQRDIVDAVCAGKNTLAIMPTGGGKSLCFQLPALARDGLTVVISPLIALMLSSSALSFVSILLVMRRNRRLGGGRT